MSGVRTWTLCGFVKPFCNICAGESPRNEVDACWSRLIQNLSLNPVPHHINKGVIYVYILLISVEGKSKEICKDLYAIPTPLSAQVAKLVLHRDLSNIPNVK